MNSGQQAEAELLAAIAFIENAQPSALVTLTGAQRRELQTVLSNLRASGGGSGKSAIKSSIKLLIGGGASSQQAQTSTSVLLDTITALELAYFYLVYFTKRPYVKFTATQLANLYQSSMAIKAIITLAKSITAAELVLISHETAVKVRQINSDTAAAGGAALAFYTDAVALFNLKESAQATAGANSISTAMKIAASLEQQLQENSGSAPASYAVPVLPIAITNISGAQFARKPPRQNLTRSYAQEKFHSRKSRALASWQQMANWKRDKWQQCAEMGGTPAGDMSMRNGLSGWSLFFREYLAQHIQGTGVPISPCSARATDPLASPFNFTP